MSTLDLMGFQKVVNELRKSKSQSDDNKEAIEQLEQEYKGLINNSFSKGENRTPYTWNNKQVYCYYINDTINLPSSGITVLFSNVDEIISSQVFVYNAFGDIHTNTRWLLIPLVQRASASTQINFGVNDNGECVLLNWTITGDKNFKGYIYFTKKDE